MSTNTQIITNLVLFFLAGLLFAALGIFLAWLVSPKKPTLEKLQPYECGVEIFGEAWQPNDLGYYLYALVFVIFDIECVFLFPIAYIFKGMGILVFLEITIFVFILILALFYALRKKALKWH